MASMRKKRLIVMSVVAAVALTAGLGVWRISRPDVDFIMMEGERQLLTTFAPQGFFSTVDMHVSTYPDTGHHELKVLTPAAALQASSDGLALEGRSASYGLDEKSFLSLNAEVDNEDKWALVYDHVMKEGLDAAVVYDRDDYAEEALASLVPDGIRRIPYSTRIDSVSVTQVLSQLDGVDCLVIFSPAKCIPLVEAAGDRTLFVDSIYEHTFEQGQDVMVVAPDIAGLANALDEGAGAYAMTWSVRPAKDGFEVLLDKLF